MHCTVYTIQNIRHRATVLKVGMWEVALLDLDPIRLGTCFQAGIEGQEHTVAETKFSQVNETNYQLLHNMSPSGVPVAVKMAFMIGTTSTHEPL